jgi:hypothetical protein
MTNIDSVELIRFNKRHFPPFYCREYIHDKIIPVFTEILNEYDQKAQEVFEMFRSFENYLPPELLLIIYQYDVTTWNGGRPDHLMKAEDMYFLDQIGSFYQERDRRLEKAFQDYICGDEITNLYYWPFHCEFSQSPYVRWGMVHNPGQWIN